MLSHGSYEAAAHILRMVVCCGKLLAHHIHLNIDGHVAGGNLHARVWNSGDVIDRKTVMMQNLFVQSLALACTDSFTSAKRRSACQEADGPCVDLLGPGHRRDGLFGC